MFKRLLLMLVLMCVAAPAIADDEKVITNYPPNVQTEQRTEKQVLVLPQDENKLFMTVYGTPGEERYEKLQKWFNENAELRTIRQQTHYAKIDTTSKLFKERYADEIETVPCVRFVTPGGTELLKIDGNKIPMSDLSLNNGIRTELMQRLFNRNGNGNGNDEDQKKSPRDKFKEELNKKIDNDLDLPPVAKAVASNVIHKIVYTIFLIVIVGGGALGVISAVREARRS